MKLWNYVVIITGLAIFLQFAGISISGFQSIFDLIGITINSTGLSNVNVSASSFWDAVFGAAGILVAVGTGIIIGTFSRTTPENYIVLPLITGTLYIFGSIIWGIVNYSLTYSGWISAVLGLVLLPLGIGFILSAVDYFRGID